MKKIMVFAVAAMAVSLFGAAKFDDLPAELKQVPAEKMIKMDGKQFSLYRNGKKIKDADSSSEICLTWIPGKGGKFSLPTTIGIYDRAAKKGVAHLRLKTVEQNEKFNWYKIGSGTIGKDTIIYITDWHICIPLKKFWKADGSNKFEFWISAKFQGPAYVKGSAKENAYIIDRAILIAK